MNSRQNFERYQDLQRYVGWTDEDAGRIQSAAAVIEPHISELIDDFYAEIQRHPRALRVITGGDEQIARLKQTLRQWLRDLFAGPYDEPFVQRRWRVGLRHVEIGLDQVYVNAALSRLRSGMTRVLLTHASSQPESVLPTLASLDKLLDLELATVEDAYQYEFNLRQKRVERLITIGQMAGGLAHELRNPLNVIKTSVYFLLNARKADPEKQREHLERIYRQVGLADDVITALSNFAKLPMPDFEAIEVPEFLREVLSHCEIPETVEVVVECRPPVPRLLGDRKQLAIVMSNLVRNAIEAMPNGGRLTISASPDHTRVRLCVEDTGHGISPQDLQRILEPFYSTKVRGIGLGLAIVRAIVENHRGEIEVSSQPGNGSRFAVRLPATHEAS